MLYALVFAIGSTLFIEAVSRASRRPILQRPARGMAPLLNVLIFAAVWLLFCAVTGEVRVSGALALLLPAVLALASAMKFAVRGQPLLPPDLALVSEGIEIFRRERLPYDRRTAPLTAAALAGLLLLALILPRAGLAIPYRAASILAGAAILLAIIYFRRIPRLDKVIPCFEALDSRQNYDRIGFLLGLATMADLMLVRRPPEYGPAAIAAIASEFGAAPHPSASLQVPLSFVVILGESFLDPARLSGIRFAPDPAPTFDSLAETFGRIDLITPVFGGGTCKAEFEMLCGGNMLFLPPECYAYVQIIQRPTPSIASILRERGYATSFLYPMSVSYYNARAAASHLGFTHFRAIDQWTCKEWSGLFVSDASATEELIREIAHLKAPYFVVLNTLEGHDPYSPGRYGSEDAGILECPTGNREILGSCTIAPFVIPMPR